MTGWIGRLEFGVVIGGFLLKDVIPERCSPGVGWRNAYARAGVIEGVGWVRIM